MKSRRSIEDGRRLGAWLTSLHRQRRSTSHRRQQLVAAIIGVEFSAALPLDRGTARRGRSAFRDAEGAAQAVGALAGLARGKGCAGGADADTKSAAAAISIINLMAALRSADAYPRANWHPPARFRDPSAFTSTISPNSRADAAKSARSLHKIIPAQCTNIAASGFGRAARRVSFGEVSTAGIDVLQEQDLPGNYPAPGQPIDELALAEIKGAILAKLRLAIGKDAGMATRRDWYKAAALALRDRIVHRWLTAEKESYDAGSKRVYYLSLEFLIGRLFTDALNNMGLLPVFEAALGDLGVGLDDLRKCEPDAALGNGGLGRLAACFMESMATLAIPAIGYGIRYDFGLFRQIIAQGWQHEYPGRMAELRQPLGIPAGGGGLPHSFRRPRRSRRRPRARPRDLASGGNRAGRRLRHPDRGLARPARQRAAAMVGALARSAAARRLQHRRLSRRRRRGSARGIDLQIPLSERRKPGGPRAAAAAGIFLRLRLAAGSDQAASRLRRTVAQPRPPRSRCSSTTPIRASPSPN